MECTLSTQWLSLTLAAKTEFDVKKEIHSIVNIEDLADFNSRFYDPSHYIYDVDQ